MDSLSLSTSLRSSCRASSGAAQGGCNKVATRYGQWHCAPTSRAPNPPTCRGSVRVFAHRLRRGPALWPRRRDSTLRCQRR
eukprot:4452387-Prymnesium_polylepis.1